MWVQPTMLAPASGFSPWALFLREMRADMSVEEHTASGESGRTQRSGSISEGKHSEYINRPAQSRPRCSKWCKMGTESTEISATAGAAQDSGGSTGTPAQQQI